MNPVDRSLAYVVFGTTVGHCALVWDERGAVVGSTLAQRDADETRRAVLRWYPRAVEAPPPAAVARAAAAVRALLEDGTGDLTGIALDPDAVPEFDRRVYELVRGIPPGETLTYGEVAARLGAPGAAQAVGQALGRNPFPPIVPCHRVLAAGRKVGGFSARGGPRTKLRMLETEGVHLEHPTLFDL
ncbi:methylated-DNA--[protein]-cysteine S-methyltransferase [Isoptericola variabilis]|uniref:Methylated-DNA/protein-cysteine methyltransferase n=1 Tax=Isoptericola variabilis (strain 225) TaxID=743718 RepID=F6FW83_ISOV2|nr:MGMT family protein [Isoptericola variabilis]AEG45627.1 methylated-DNA/protein-cysteine methyltransferase [Isoptericola variabilis 225]TWH25764.1 methylated-DNA-[protein]-cysteine S-methyltransferase [Isoptericola variabilis J7]